HADDVGDLAGMGDGHAVDLGKRLGIEALGAAEHVQPAPVDTRFEEAVNEDGYAIRVDTERARAAADGDPALLDRKRWRDPHRDLRLDTDIFPGPDGACRLALAFDADRRARPDRRLKLRIALAGACEVDRNAREPGSLKPLQLAFRGDPEAVYIPTKEFEQRLVRICSNGIMQCNTVGHRAFETSDLGADDLIVIDEQRGAARFGDKLLGGNAADKQLAVIRGKVGRDRSVRLHSRSPPLFPPYSAAIASYS